MAPNRRPVAWAVVGRVRGEGRRPAVAVDVALWVHGELRVTGKTDAAGRFRLSPESVPAIPWVTLTVVARNARGRRAVRNRASGPTRTEDLDVGTMVLVVGHPLDVVVIGDAGPVAGARVEVHGGIARRQGFVESATTDHAGRARFTGLPAENFRIITHAAGFARALRHAGLPRLEAEPLRVRMERPRTVEVVIVEQPGERPVPGIEIQVVDQYRHARGSYSTRHVPPIDVRPTDESGRTRVTGLGREPSLHLGIAARGHATVHYARFTEQLRTTHTKLVPIPPDEDIVRIVLPAGRRVRWPIEAGEVPMPPDGTALTIRRDIGRDIPSGVESGLVEAGHVVLRDLPADQPLRAFVATSDGAIAFLEVGATETEGAAVSFTRPRTLEVTALHANGTRVADRGLSLLGGESSWSTWGRTDANGVVRMTGLPAGQYELWVRSTKTDAVDVDLREGDARIEVRLPDDSLGSGGHPVRIRVLCDGQPRLPDEYRLQGDMLGVSARVEEEDPENAVLTARWWPGEHGGGDGGSLYLRARGYVKGRQQVSPDAQEVTFDLQPAGRLLYTVLYAKTDDWRHRVRGVLQRWDETAREWVKWEWTVRQRRMLEPPLWGESYLLESVAPGRFRAVARPTGQVSEEVLVEAGGPPARLLLDARGQGKVRGRMTGPPGTDLRGAFVWVVDPARPQAGHDVPVRENGRFEFPWDAGVRALVLTARHPMLRPHGERGRVRLTSASDAVNLELARGSVAQLTIDVEAFDGKRPSPPSAPRVLLLDPAATRAAPPVLLPARIDVQKDGTWRLQFSGFESGRQTVWADLNPGYAPLRLEDAILDELDPDLGVVTLSPGSTVHVVFESRSEKAPEILMLRAESVDGPTHARYAALENTREISVTGLGAGRYRVRGGTITLDDTIPDALDEVIEVDGRSTYERRVRLE